MTATLPDSLISGAVDVPISASNRDVNGVRLHTVAAGDPDDPLVVLLHGFPECWYGWHRQIEPLVDAGFRVVAPDQRGYNRSEKPPRVRDYRLSELSGDVVALIESEDRDSAHVVGHDWGGFVAWDLARRHPDVVDRLCILNVPHYSAYRRALVRNPRQLSRSWYAFCFQLPWLPEWLVRARNYGFLTGILETAQPGTFTESDLEVYRDSWRRDGALTGMLNWYRAMPRYSRQPAREQVEAPTCIVWGEDDPALVSDLASASLEYCTDGRVELLQDVGHFVQHEAPDRVAGLLVDHLSTDAGPGADGA